MGQTQQHRQLEQRHFDAALVAFGVGTGMHIAGLWHWPVTGVLQSYFLNAIAVTVVIDRLP